MRSGDHLAHALQPALDEPAQKRRPKGLVLGRPDIGAEDLALAVAGDAEAVRRSGRVLNAAHCRAQLGADPRDLRLGDDVNSQRCDHSVTLAHDQRRLALAGRNPNFSLTPRGGARLRARGSQGTGP